MASIHKSSIRGLVSSSNIPQMCHNLHPLIKHIDRGLHRSIFACLPIGMNISPVVRSPCAVVDVVELTLVLYIKYMNINNKIPSENVALILRFSLLSSFDII